MIWYDMVWYAHMQSIIDDQPSATTKVDQQKYFGHIFGQKIALKKLEKNPHEWRHL